MNILQIDVEDWYHDYHIDVEDWYHDPRVKNRGSYEDRVVQNTSLVLDILKEKKIEATFFVLGYVAQYFPELIKRIKEENHEVATHGYAHVPVTKQTPSEFESDLQKSLESLEKVGIKEVLGYRAPHFTIVEETAWAIDILQKYGLKYDSSIFPVKTRLYGVPQAPLFPYFISSSDIRRAWPRGELLEIPLSVYRMPIIRKNIPVAGGFYLRFFPYFLVKKAIQKINKLGQPAICYLHPWELDSEQPRISSLGWYHYYGLSSAEKKFRRLLADFEFTSVREYFGFG